VSRSEPSPKRLSRRAPAGARRGTQRRKDPRRRGPAPRGNDNPSPGVAPKSRDDDEVENPKEAMPVSREIGCASVGGYPGAPTGWSARGQSGEAREGRWAGSAAHAGRCKMPRRDQTQGGCGAVTWLNPRPACRIRACARSLKGRRSSKEPSRKPEGSGARESVRHGVGKASKGNPRSGTGMKQARQVVGGAKRREGAKPWGRNVTGGLGSRRG
jgi:hypothetical protein